MIYVLPHGSLPFFHSVLVLYLLVSPACLDSSSSLSARKSCPYLQLSYWPFSSSSNQSTLVKTHLYNVNNIPQQKTAQAFPFTSWKLGYGSVPFRSRQTSTLLNSLSHSSQPFAPALNQLLLCSRNFTVCVSCCPTFSLLLWTCMRVITSNSQTESVQAALKSSPSKKSLPLNLASGTFLGWRQKAVIFSAKFHRNSAVANTVPSKASVRFSKLQREWPSNLR